MHYIGSMFLLTGEYLLRDGDGDLEPILLLAGEGALKEAAIAI